MKKPRKKILFIVQLPPPVHGASIMNENLVKSDYIQTHYHTKVLNIVTAQAIDSIGKFSIGKVFAMVQHFFQIIKSLVFFRPDLVYFTISPAGLAFYRDVLYIGVLKLFRRKLVFHFHGKGIQQNAAQSKLFAILCKIILKNAYSIHMSETLVKDIDGFDNNGRFVVSYGIPVEVSSMPIKDRGPKTRILYLSNYVKTKGVLDLIDAAALVVKQRKDFHISLVGKGADLSEEDLLNYIQQKGLQECVTVCGPKYKEDKFRILSESDVFVLPTYYLNEAFPIALLEAMQFGMPCITTREGGIQDMIEDGETGFLVNKRCPEELAESILTLLNDKERIKRMGEKARNRFLESYTISHFLNGMVNVFDKIMGPK